MPRSRGMNVAIRNANDGISLAQTAEGALGKIGDNLQRMRELAVQAANDTNGTSDRTALDNEYKQLAAENARVIANTQFNGQALLTGAGGASGTFTFQVGANSARRQPDHIMTTDIATAMGTNTQGGAATLGATAALARTAMDNIDTALTAVNGARSTLGASQSRFDAVIAQPAGRGREPDRRAQPHRRCRLRRRDRQPLPRADPAAGRHGDGGAGEPVAAAGADPASLDPRKADRPFKNRQLGIRARPPRQRGARQRTPLDRAPLGAPFFLARTGRDRAFISTHRRRAGFPTMASQVAPR